MPERRGSRSASISLWPPSPPSEGTELEQALRLEEEKEAKRVSDAIDRAIELEKQHLRKQRKHAKVLLLGQSESGKSTMLKNFQLHFAPNAFKAEAEAWRAIIHLNLIRSVNFVIDLLSSPGSANGDVSNASRQTRPSSAHRISQSNGQGSDSVRKLRMRLSPLRQVEMALIKILSGNDPRSPGPSGPAMDEVKPWYYGRASEVYVRGGSGWKSLLGKQSAREKKLHELDDARQILDACKDDIAALWSNVDVQARLQAEGVLLHEQSGFFLDQAERVASLGYVPSCGDILKARLQTVGVEEYRLVTEIGSHSTGGHSGETWIFYDVGGAKGQRAAWAPYFDDGTDTTHLIVSTLLKYDGWEVQAIIFLCSMSGFNEVLIEDTSTNRLYDSLNLWKVICSSKLLAGATFILLLNKCDLLEAKLKAGVVFANYVRSYKDGPNDSKHVLEYLKAKFEAMHMSHSPRPRPLHIHPTCALDVELMADVVVRIREAIVINSLRAADLL